MRRAISGYPYSPLKSCLRPNLNFHPSLTRASRVAIDITPRVVPVPRSTFSLYTTHQGQPLSIMTTTKTIPLYQTDERQHTHTTTIQKIYPVSLLSETNKPLFKSPSEKDFILVVAETVFYAQGGGQPSDTGIITLDSDREGVIFTVSSVRNGEGGEILHLGSFSTDIPDGSEEVPFKTGDAVFQKIDSEKRVLNSRIHTAGHIIGLSVRALTLSTGEKEATIPPVTELKAQHYPDLAFVDFQGSIEGKFKDAIQKQVDEYVAAKLPVKVYFWNEEELREKCAVVPGAVSIPEGELVRAVDIVGAGAYPCGGTHVEDTGVVGKVTVKKISRSKGNSKVSYTVS
ncbi:Threonyl/alanyl tRNA synthetase [Aspergillus karnatakaensis]|uniref:putative alanine--tRNA ligase n=1 Tax=Aspergillus karnatakaensis TaxID=1810916 RepID=UPI003CCD5C75